MRKKIKNHWQIDLEKGTTREEIDFVMITIFIILDNY